MLTPRQRDLLRGDNPAVISTNMPESAPMIVPTWFLLDKEDRVILSIDAGSSRGGRLLHLRRDPHFTITVIDRSVWTDAVTVFCIATDFVDDLELEYVDLMAQKHNLPAYDIRRPRTVVRASIDGVLDSGERTESEAGAS